MKLTIDEQVKFKEVCKNSKSMSIAAAELNMHFNTFKRYAIELKVYKTNQGGKGINKPSSRKIPLDEILKGLHPSYQTYKLKIRLYEEGIKKNECEECELSKWNGQNLNCELDHIDGDRTNHRLENLRILCPNCHSQTPTYRALNIR